MEMPINNETQTTKKFLIIMGITIAIVVFFTNLISKRQEERVKMLSKARSLSAEVERLEVGNSRLHRLHNALLTDPVEIERYARNNLNYLAPGEKVYKRYNFKIMTDDKEIKEKAISPFMKSLLEGIFPWQIPALILLISSIVFYVSYSFGNGNKRG